MGVSAQRYRCGAITGVRDLREFYDPDLHLPINGNVYTVKCPSADLGLRIRTAVVEGIKQDEELRFIAELLGATYDPETDRFHGGLWDEMVSNNVSLEEALHVGNTALAHYGVSPEFGEYWWENRLGKEHEPLVPESAIQWSKSRQAHTATSTKTKKSKKHRRSKKARTDSTTQDQEHMGQMT